MRRLLPIPLLILVAGCTPALTRAIIKGDKARIDALLTKGVNVNAGKYPKVAIAQAVLHGDAALVERLLAKGADKNIGMRIAAIEGNVGMMQVFIAKGVDLDSGPIHYLYYTALHGHRRAAELLVGKGSDVNRPDHLGNTPLSGAIWSNHIALAKILLRKGADPEPASARFRNLEAEFTIQHPALAAKMRSNIEILEHLVKELADEKERKIIARATASVRRKAREQTKRMHTDVEFPSYKIQPTSGDFAIVIGIEKYRDLPKAEYAERDADLIKRHLLALGVPRRNLIYLTGSRAEYSSLKKYLESWLPRNVGPHSRVYFYFSGHGAPDPNTGEAYLMPWNGDPSFLLDTAYPVSKLYRKLKALPAKEIIVALDACFSGSGGRSVLAKGTRPLVTNVDTSAGRGSKLTVFTAAGGSEITSTLDEVGHGIFTYFFVKGLNGAAKNAAGNVTARALYDYLRPNVQDEARRQNRAQTPSLQILPKRTLILRGD